jgi:small-conductance mechanosensitive channel
MADVYSYGFLNANCYKQNRYLNRFCELSSLRFHTTKTPLQGWFFSHCFELWLIFIWLRLSESEYSIHFMKLKMDSGSHVTEARADYKLDVTTLIQGLFCIGIVVWCCVQLHFQYSPYATNWGRAQPEEIVTNLNYLVFWMRILPGLMVLYAGYMFLTERLTLAAIYSGIFLLHLYVVFATDRLQLVRGLAAAAGL